MLNKLYLTAFIASQYFPIMLLVKAYLVCQGLPLTVIALVLQVGHLGCPQKWLLGRVEGEPGCPCPHFHLRCLGRLVWHAGWLGEEWRLRYFFDVGWSCRLLDGVGRQGPFPRRSQCCSIASFVLTEPSFVDWLGGRMVNCSHGLQCPSLRVW